MGSRFHNLEAPLTELSKLEPLVKSLTRLAVVLRPGRRLDRLIASFRTRWVVEHAYVLLDGKYRCVNGVQFRDAPLPAAPRRPDSPLRSACRGLRATAGVTANAARRNRKLLRAAGGVVL